MRTKLWIPAAVAFLLGIAGAAEAGFSVFSQSTCGVVLTSGVNGIKDVRDDNLFVNTFPDAESVQATAADCGIGVGSASSDAKATFGKLTANSLSVDAEDPVAFPSALAGADGGCVVEDTLHVTSASLPYGTHVLLDFSLNLSTNYSSSTGDPGAAAGVTSVLDAVVHGPTATTSVQLEFDSVSEVSTLTGELDAIVGYDVALSYEIHAQSAVTAVSDANGRQAGLVSQPRIHANGANPDVASTTDSGFDYGLPVPEADAVEADVGALVMIVLLRRSRGAAPSAALR